jgi:hypothetical protein
MKVYSNSMRREIRAGVARIELTHACNYFVCLAVCNSRSFVFDVFDYCSKSAKLQNRKSSLTKDRTWDA